MKKIPIEKIAIGGLLFLFIYTVMSGIKDPFAILYNALGSLYASGIFYFFGLIWIGNPARTKPRGYYWKALAISILSGWFVITLCYALYIQHLSDYPMVWWSIFHPGYVEHFLEWLVIGAVTGNIYGYFRRSILTGKTKLLKIVSGIAVTAALVYGGAVLWSLNYSGSEKVRFLDRDQELMSFKEVLSQPELEGKKIYVDFWYSSCSPCIGAFKNMNSGKELLKEEGYITLYMGRETSHPDSKARWLKVISDFDLEGYHVYMSKQLEDEMTERVMQKTERWFGYPHYLLINEAGDVINWDAPGIVDIELLSKSIVQLPTTKTSANLDQ